MQTSFPPIEITPPVQAAIPYRPEIDGLRAVAVLAVIVFHAKLGLLSGGFIGVDVFFVISGFLITSIIAHDNETIGFDIFRFYERRVRRIFPVLFVVIATTALFSAALLVPRDYTNFARSAFAAMAFYSNFYFSSTAGYFMPAAETQPLLHTWSLGVEEQFYLLAPFFIVLFENRLRRFRTWAYAALFAISLAISARGVEIDARWAFYLPHSRAFELLTGSIIALGLIPPVTTKSTANALGFFGLSLIAAAAAGFSSRTPFPGFTALLPTLGTALVIHSATSVQTIAARWLAIPPLLFVGKISYSLYLWHWPLLALAEYKYGGALQSHDRLALLAAALALSYASYRLVEQPARKASARRTTVLAAGLASIAVCFAASQIIVRTNGLPQRLAAPAAKLALDLATQTAADEKAVPACLPKNATGCAIGYRDAGHTSFLLWGDSHGETFATGFDEAGKASGLKGLSLGRGGCPPLLAFESNQRQFKNCPEVAQRIEAALKDPRITHVIIVARWAYYGPGAPSSLGATAQDRMLIADDAGQSSQTLAALLVSTVEKIRRSGKRVTVIGPVPELAVNLPLALMKAAMNGQFLDYSPPWPQYAARQAPVLAVLQRLALLDGVTVAYPHQYLCTPATCRSLAGKSPLYVDDNHLSVTGVRELRAMIAQILEAGLDKPVSSPSRTHWLAKP